jgi:hypothetical protein
MNMNKKGEEAEKGADDIRRSMRKKSIPIYRALDISIMLLEQGRRTRRDMSLEYQKFQQSHRSERERNNIMREGGEERKGILPRIPVKEMVCMFAEKKFHQGKDHLLLDMLYLILFNFI